MLLYPVNAFADKLLGIARDTSNPDRSLGDADAALFGNPGIVGRKWVMLDGLELWRLTTVDINPLNVGRSRKRIVVNRLKIHYMLTFKYLP